MGSPTLGRSTSLIQTTARPTPKFRIFRSVASSPLVLRGERCVSKAIILPPQTTSHPVYTAFGAEHIDSHPSNIEGGTCLRTAHATTLSPNELIEGPTDTLSPEFERTSRMLHMRPESWPCSTAVAEHRLPHNCYMNAPHTPEGRIMLKAHHAVTPASPLGTEDRSARHLTSEQYSPWPFSANSVQSHIASRPNPHLIRAIYIYEA